MTLLVGPIPTYGDLTEHPDPKARAHGAPGNRLSGPWRAWFEKLARTTANTGGNGATVSRPVSNLYVGMPFFDTTLGKPVFVKTISPTPVWVDATGAVV